VKIVVPVFYALNDTKYPVIGSFLAVCSNFLFIIFSLSALQHRAIALATSLSMILNFVFLSAVLYFKVQGYPLRHVSRCLAKICLAAGIMGVTVHFLAQSLQPFFNLGLIGRLAGLFTVMIVGLLVYGLSVYMFKIPEFQELTSTLKRFRQRT
jgi:putative peptidoglycan lipid II flippase